MRRLRRVVVLSMLLLAIGAFGVTDSGAICGAPGIVAASAFGGGTGIVILFNPVAPFNFTGMSSVPFGGAVAEKQYDLWRTAVASAPANFLSIAAPAPAACGVCALVGGPFPNCPGPTITLMFD